MTMTGLDVTRVLNALEKWIGQRSGLNMADYGFHREVPGSWKEARRALGQDARQIAKDGREARAALATARAIPEHPDLLQEAFRAFSGRLEWDGDKLSYTTGQYWPTEYRSAARAVLQLYVSLCQTAEQQAHPRTFVYLDMADVRAANAKVGGHWFDRGALRFFNSKLESKLIGGRFFVTSERMELSYPKKYTVRRAEPNGDIETVGEFQGYHYRSDALQAARLAAKS